MAERRRCYRVAEKIREILSVHLLNVADPRFERVTITSVMVSTDLKEAKIYWDIFGDQKKIKLAEAAFKSAGGYFRAQMAKDLGTRYVPKLHFFYDDTREVVDQVSNLMEQINEK